MNQSVFPPLKSPFYQAEQALPLTEYLSSWFGFEQFNQGQQQVIEHILHGHSALAVFPTGSGKSLCYQFSALCLPNVTLVVSPLLALMKDQLAFLRQKGIAAASIDSTLDASELKQVMQGVRDNQVKVLMVSVERFKNERFRQFLASIKVSLLVIDEAHCISEWGHNFRPDYLKIPQLVQTFNINQVLLLTATATKQVKADMAARFDIQAEHIVQTGFERSNLTLSVNAVAQSNKKQALVEQIRNMDQQFTSHANQSASLPSGIVYVTLQQTTEEVAQFLKQHGINAAAYHAGIEYDKRQHIQNAFMAGDTDIIVATIAFGMGIDKSDIRFVIHYDLPKSIENYSQEIGRAGRDGQQAQCVTLANLDNINTVENFVYADTPQRDDIAALIDLISDQYDNGRWEMQDNPVSGHTNIRTLPLKTLLVQLELAGAIQPQFAYFADFKYKFIASQADILARFNPQRQAFLMQVFEHTLFKKVWGQLDFDSLHQGYGHQRSRVVAALDYLAEQGLIALETKKMTQVYQVNLGQLQVPELLNQLTEYFAANETKEIKRIAALIAFFESNSCLSYKLAQYFDDVNATTQCGHCSVCRGYIAKLPLPTGEELPSIEIVSQWLFEFHEFCQQKGLAVPSNNLQSKFLIGMSMPVFTRSKVKQLSGFGRCQHVRFEQVKALVMQVADNAQ